MRRSCGMLWTALAGALISFVPSVAHAQSAASVRGRVTDEEGSGIPSVQVIVTNQKHGEPERRRDPVRRVVHGCGTPDGGALRRRRPDDRLWPPDTGRHRPDTG